MGSSSVPMHRGLVHWQGLLMFVLFFIFWSLPSTDQLSIVSTSCKKGEDVVLQIDSKPPQPSALVWYKGESINKNNVITFFIPTLSFHLSGPENDGRQILTEDGSLLLKNATMMDAGMYTVVAYFPNSETEIGFGQLDVYEHLRVPILLASSYGVRENKENVVLTCYTHGMSVQWLFNDMYLKFTDRRKLSADGRRITISPVKREDAGVYKCIASNPLMWVESHPLYLHVIYY